MVNSHLTIGSFVRHCETPDLEGIVVAVAGNEVQVRTVYDDTLRGYVAHAAALAPWEGDDIARDLRTEYYGGMS